MQNQNQQARPWGEVAGSEQFRALSPEHQERARELYYQDNVAPRVPQGMEQRAREVFDQDTAGSTLTQGQATIQQQGLVMPQQGAEQEQGFLGTLVGGTKSAARSAGATVNTYTGDAGSVVEASVIEGARKRDPRLEKFNHDVQKNTGMGSDDESGLWSSIKGVGSAIYDNPQGAGLAITEQLPNSVPTLGGGYAGMKLGALAGSPLGPVGAAAGGLIGGFTGMFLGNTLIETGGKAIEYAGDGDYTEEEMSKARKEGAVKGGVITGIDLLTLGVGGKISSTMRRTTEAAVESATKKALTDAGVDIADATAVAAAKSNQAVSKAVSEAQINAVKLTDTLRRRGTEAGTLLTTESVGEGFGEYLGELAATGESSIPESVLEGFLSLGQSSVQAGWNMNRARNKDFRVTDGIPDHGLKDLPGSKPVEDSQNPNDAFYIPDQSEAVAEQAARDSLDPSNAQIETTQQRPDIQHAVLEVPDTRAEAAPTEDATSIMRADTKPALVRQDQAPAVEAKKATAGEQAQYSGDSIGALERTDAAMSAMGNRHTVIEPGMLKPLGELAPLDRQKSIEGTGQSSDQSWRVPNQKVSDLDRPVLQNRDRSTDASIAQMQDIRNSPDYIRLSISRDFGNGAPVVEPGAEYLATQLGHTEITTTASGRKIPVQYAAIEAGQLLPSNDALGNSIPEYATGVEGRSRAIAGNGRVAGIAAAWKSGKAKAYKQEMIEDTFHGINPEVISAMEQPVLVRIMPLEEVTSNIGDESNVSGQAGLNPTEQASTDMRRLDLAELQLTPDNELSEATVMDFVKGMPRPEFNKLISKSGRPTAEAFARAEAALFQQAYQNEGLTENLVDLKGDAKFIMNALMRAAPAMAKLEGAGAYDIRPLVSEAAEVAVNARR